MSTKVLTVDEFNNEFKRCPVCDKMDEGKYLVILRDKHGVENGVLIYKTEVEAENANRLDKIQREIIKIKRLR